jgi:hypothetical protein
MFAVCAWTQIAVYNQGFSFLYNTFYQGPPKFCQGGAAPPAPALATPLLPTSVSAALHSMKDVDLYVSLLSGLDPSFFGNVSLKDKLALIVVVHISKSCRLQSQFSQDTFK